MSRIIRTRYDNNRCKACNGQIPYGVDVRHTGGYGVTHLDCPHGPDQAAPSGQTSNDFTMDAARTAIIELGNTIGQLTRERDAALADGQALRQRIGQMEADQASRDSVRLAVVAHVQRLVNEQQQLLEQRDQEREQLARVIRERDALLTRSAATQLQRIPVVRLVENEIANGAAPALATSQTLREHVEVEGEQYDCDL